jgi:hypothetical protein
LFSLVDSSAINNIVRTRVNNIVDNIAASGPHNIAASCSEQTCSNLLTTCNNLSVFTRVEVLLYILLYIELIALSSAEAYMKFLVREK